MSISSGRPGAPEDRRSWCGHADHLWHSRSRRRGRATRTSGSPPPMLARSRAPPSTPTASVLAPAPEQPRLSNARCHDSLPIDDLSRIELRQQAFRAPAQVKQTEAGACAQEFSRASRHDGTTSMTERNRATTLRLRTPTQVQVPGTAPATIRAYAPSRPGFEAPRRPQVQTFTPRRDPTSEAILAELAALGLAESDEGNQA